MVVVGGLGSLPGALIGALFIKSAEWFNTAVPEQFRLLFTTASTGAGLILVLNNFPQGLGGLLYDWRDAWLRRVAARHQVVVPDLAAGGQVPSPRGSQSARLVRQSAAPWWLRFPRRNAPASGYYSFPDLGSSSGRRTTLLSIRGLDVSYGQVQVLFGVTLEVAEGEVIALLGTNGAGKSTVLRAISGLAKPDAGTISFEGRDIASLPPHRITELGIMQMPGGKSVFPSLTVGENLRIAGWLQRRDPARSKAALDGVFELLPMLADMIDRPAGALSGGQQQMLGLAMALLGQPKLLMIDELSLGLAPTIVEQLLGVIRELRRRGTTIVVVEQSVNVALTVADTAYFLEKGEVKFFGPTAELLDRPDILRSVFLEGAAARHSPVARPRLSPAGRAASNAAPVVLAVEGVSKQFAGLIALTDVSLTLRAHEILGVIGPNGAGKTTLFDIVSGFISPDKGRVEFEGQDITGSRPAVRSRLGLSRSFQDARLFGGLTVHQAIMLALDRELAVRDPIAAALTLPVVEVAERQLAVRVDEIVEVMGLGDFRDKFVSELSTGTRRIVDLACQIGLHPKVILFDEPSSGIAQREAEALGPLLLRIREQLDATLLVIEHDMPLLASIADRLIALDQGAVVTAGPIDDVMQHPVVVASYLGASRSAVQRSGAVGRPLVEVT